MAHSRVKKYPIFHLPVVKLSRLFQNREALVSDNNRLVRELFAANEKSRNLELQMREIREHTMSFLLQQMETLKIPSLHTTNNPGSSANNSANSSVNNLNIGSSNVSFGHSLLSSRSVDHPEPSSRKNDRRDSHV